MKLGWLVLGGAALALSCAQEPVSSTGPQAIALTPAAATRAASTVPAGVAFDVTLDQALDTRLTRPGTPFSVTLTEPLRDTEGRVVVPAGSRIEGTVYSTGALEAPHLTLGFKQMYTSFGTAPVAVKVVSSQADRYQAWAEPPGQAGVSETMQSMPQMYEQRAAQAYQPPGTMPILLRKGAKMRLELTRPLFAPR